MKIHYLKTLPKYFKKSENDLKPFEVRLDDRHFEIGDVAILEEWDGGYTGKSLNRKVIYILRSSEDDSEEGFEGIKKGYVVLGVEELEVVESEFVG